MDFEVWASADLDCLRSGLGGYLCELFDLCRRYCFHILLVLPDGCRGLRGLADMVLGCVIVGGSSRCSHVLGV